MNTKKSYNELIEKAKEDLKSLQDKEKTPENNSHIKAIERALNIHEVIERTKLVVERAKLEQEEVSRLLKESDKIVASMLQTKNHVNKDKSQESIKKIRVDVENNSATTSNIKPKQ